MHVGSCTSSDVDGWSMPQVAHLTLEGVRGEISRSSGGNLAASVTVAGLQVDNQLVTSSRPVVLCASQQVAPVSKRAQQGKEQLLSTSLHAFLLQTFGQALAWSGSFVRVPIFQLQVDDVPNSSHATK